MNFHNFALKIINWQQQNGRHDLPWQTDINPYKIWISEVMLQQTQVKTVIPFYIKFIERFPDLPNLAQAELDEILYHWAGLGYYARARNLHQCAKIIEKNYQGKFPNSLEKLIDLPGIGRSTAGAILSLAYHQSTPILDGNVKRILCRVHRINSWHGTNETLKKLWDLTATHTPSQATNIYNQGMMDLGASVCTRSSPNCIQCPVSNWCQAAQNNEQNLYPLSKPKKDIPLKQTLIFILLNEKNDILLEKRPPIGIWGGLWSLPLGEISVDVKKYIKKIFNLNTLTLKNLPSFDHQFTHFRLRIHPVLLNIRRDNHLKVMEDLSYKWYKKDQIKTLGLPKPINTLLQTVSQFFA